MNLVAMCVASIRATLECKQWICLHVGTLDYSSLESEDSLCLLLPSGCS